MEIDSEEPPDLIDINAGQSVDAALSTELEDLRVSTVPLSIITGYLGSGKTTLVNYILNEQHGKKIAVILNEFADTTPIERRAINVTSSTSSGPESSIDFLTLGNGCICCSVKDAGLNAIEQLLSRHASTPGTKPFDSIILETSGLADPGGIIPNFWTDEGLGSSVRLDGVVTVVDASNLLRSLEEPKGGELASDLEGAGLSSHDGVGEHETVAHLQLSVADSIILNKTDLVNTVQLEAVEARIRSINASASISHTTYGKVKDLAGTVVDLHAYDTFDPSRLSTRSHSHLDPTITTLTIPLPPLTPTQLSNLERWLQLLLWENVIPGLSLPSPPSTFSIHRLKSLLYLTTGEERMIQGVREIFEISTPSSPSPPPIDASADGSGGGGESDDLVGKIVFIGRGLDDESAIGSSLGAALGI